jgi:hypothetical protein
VRGKSGLPSFRQILAGPTEHIPIGDETAIEPRVRTTDFGSSFCIPNVQAPTFRRGLAEPDQPGPPIAADRQRPLSRST